MLNLTLVQKLNYRRLSAFRNVHHKGYKNFGMQSCVNRLAYIKSKLKYNKGMTRTDNCLSSHLIPDRPCWQWWEFLQLSFSSGRKVDAEYGLFVFRNEKLDIVVETLPKLFLS